jgi:spore germination cell wall hydrolase CwlJ-like protein
MIEFNANVYLLALLVYREAGGEPDEGKVAVAYTVMTRAQHPCWWGTTPYDVITKREQYSSMTHLGDPQTVKFPSMADPVFRRCLEIADKVMLFSIPNPALRADSYYAAWMDAKGMTPKWADPAKFICQIGGHKFYSLGGDTESPAV